MDQRINFDAFNEGNLAWKAQMVAAFRPNSGDEDDLHEASASEWTVHVIALPWKVLFALVPPPMYCDGWLCFCVALTMIGLVTALIGDLAEMLGCILGLDPGITAITIVAVGTSLPDAFASKTAAIEDDSADNAIGNVTGSNSVNVFLGIGLPWMVAAIFWEGKTPDAEWKRRYPQSFIDYPQGGFVVEAGNLVFSVICFSIAALICLGIIWYRRKTFGAELGGPDGAKANSCIFLVLLWFFYVGLAIWKIEAGEQPLSRQLIAIVVGCFSVGGGMVFVSACLTLYKAVTGEKNQELKRIIELLEAQAGGGSQDLRPEDVASMSGEDLVFRLKDQVKNLGALARALEMKVSREAKARMCSVRNGMLPKDKVDAQSVLTPSSEELDVSTNGDNGYDGDGKSARARKSSINDSSRKSSMSGEVANSNGLQSTGVQPSKPKKKLFKKQTVQSSSESKSNPSPPKPAE
jgi:hypothetical protein